MKKLLLKLFIMLTSPIWFLPFIIILTIKTGWEIISEFVEKRS